ncbi:Uncharacterised protein [Amycolatopsis camponoti]|uniref:Uncharacterized protein n=1 Tax=Amycolatopsis camponoti TaxID=2606593 RepID=A0A6I8LDW5_9PSEU|nr:hypothetical protein [Amycolatopsis camponoti]VVJ15514.1 Uncharacterised protein [Amycolatopsis camponoti]
MASPDELIPQIFDAVERVLPPKWRHATFRVWATVVAYQTELTVVMTDGSSPEVAPPAVTNLLAALREAMYQPGRGTWFSAAFLLRAGEEPEATFNYDQDPRWFPELPPVAFARDLAAFPRADEWIPEWLRRVLADAAAMVPAPED